MELQGRSNRIWKAPEVQAAEYSYRAAQHWGAWYTIIWHSVERAYASGRAMPPTAQCSTTPTAKADPTVSNIAEWPESGAMKGVSNCIGNPDADASNFTAPEHIHRSCHYRRTEAALASADWSLRAGSEFIDAGTSTDGLQEATDMAGNPRVMGAASM